jgi:hypothetical protein
MSDMFPLVAEAMNARRDGRYDDALRILTGMFGRAAAPDADPLSNHFMMMFEWSLLADEYGRARVALAVARDEQVRLVLAGDDVFGAGTDTCGTRPRSL